MLRIIISNEENNLRDWFKTHIIQPISDTWSHFIDWIKDRSFRQHESQPLVGNTPLFHANSKAPFKNVGFLEARFTLFGLFNYRQFSGSAVYIHSNKVLTASHVLNKEKYNFWPIIKFEDYTFNTVDEAGAKQAGFKVQAFQHSTNDLSIVHIEDPIDHLETLSIDFSGKDQSNCTAVGFGLDAELDGTWSTQDGKKRAYAIPSTTRRLRDKFYGSLLGYDLYSDSSNRLCARERDYNGKEGGISPGMSGGALFNANNELIGIGSHVTHSSSIPEHDHKNDHWKTKSTFWSFSSAIAFLTCLPTLGLSPETGEAHFWCSLADHNEFLSEELSIPLFR